MAGLAHLCNLQRKGLDGRKGAGCEGDLHHLALSDGCTWWENRVTPPPHIRGENSASRWNICGEAGCELRMTL